jgi:UPF0176 protein
MSYKIANFYKFVELEDLPGLRLAMLAAAGAHELIGTIILAPEGINASLAGTQEGLEAFADGLRADPRFCDLTLKLSDGDRRPFRKLYIRLKPWIIRFADDVTLTPAEIDAGKRVSPTQMRDLVRATPEDVVLVDTRNWYETDYGSFAGARRLPIKRFTQFREAFEEEFGAARDKTFVFFCTGGIRCEKVAPWAERQGFPNSYQLDGGILNYFKEYGDEGFEGRCFVFDGRWLVDGRLTETDDDALSLRIQPKPLPRPGDRGAP